MKKIVIELTNQQYDQFQKFLKEESEINQKEETFSGWSITVSSTEFGLSWLELEVNNKLDLGDVNLSFE